MGEQASGTERIEGHRIIRIPNSAHGCTVFVCAAD